MYSERVHLQQSVNAIFVKKGLIGFNFLADRLIKTIKE